MNRPRTFTGTYTAIVTPFKRGAVAYDELRKLVNFQVKSGISGVVPVGTTGESPTVSHEEHLEIIRGTIEACDGRVPVIAGTGSNSTREAIEMTQAADAAGADGFLQVAPYYNRPTQEGLFQHFARIAEATTSRSFFTRSPAVAASRSASRSSNGCAPSILMSPMSKKRAAASTGSTRLYRPWAIPSPS